MDMLFSRGVVKNLENSPGQYLCWKCAEINALLEFGCRIQMAVSDAYRSQSEKWPEMPDFGGWQAFLLKLEQLTDLYFQAVLQHHQRLYILVLAKQLQKTLWTYRIIRHSASVIHFRSRI